MGKCSNIAAKFHAGDTFDLCKDCNEISVLGEHKQCLPRQRSQEPRGVNQ